MAELHVIGEIVGGVGFDASRLFCRWLSVGLCFGLKRRLRDVRGRRWLSRCDWLLGNLGCRDRRFVFGLDIRQYRFWLYRRCFWWCRWQTNEYCLYGWL